MTDPSDNAQHSALSTQHSPLVRACLITNPRSGRGGIDLSEVLPVLEAHGWEVAVRQKLHGGHATELAREAARDGCGVVVGCGGDGTLSEIADGLAGTDVAMGALPGGTQNLWAHELGIAARLRVAALQLVGAERRRIDLGHVTINGRHGRHFLLMAGLGADGAVMARVSKPLKSRFGPLAVGLAAVQMLPALRAIPVRAELDGVHWRGRVVQVVAGNTRRYGGFTSVTPDALVDDGLLDVCLITAAGAAATGRQIASLLVRRRPDGTTAETYRVARLVLYAPLALPLQVDGGAVRLKKESPTAEGMIYEFAARARALSVLVPRTHDGALFAPPAARAVTLLDGHRPLRGDAEGPARSEHEGGTKDQKAAKEPRRVLAVLAVGMDTITAVRLADGRTLTVKLVPETVVQDDQGAPLDPRTALAGLAVGQLLRVKGKKGPDRATIAARKVRLLAAPGAEEAPPALEDADEGQEEGDNGE